MYEKFNGKADILASFLFNIKWFCEVVGIGDSFEITKMATLPLDDKALTRWCGVAQEA